MKKQKTVPVKVRISLLKLVSFLEKFDILPTTIYAVDGYARVIEGNAKRPFIIWVPDRYLLPVSREKTIPIREIVRDSITKTTDNTLIASSELFGLATLTYPLFTIELNEIRYTYTLNTNEIRADTKVVKKTAKGNDRITSLEHDTDRIISGDDPEITPNMIKKSRIVKPKIDNGVELVFVDRSESDVILEDLTTGLPEALSDPRTITKDTDDDSLAMIYPAVALDSFFKLMKSNPRIFSRELNEAYMHRDTECESTRNTKFNTVLKEFEHFKEKYTLLNDRIKELSNEEKRLSDVLEKISAIPKVKSDKERLKLESARIRLQTLALRREAEIERMRLESRILEMVDVMTSTFDYLKTLFIEE